MRYHLRNNVFFERENDFVVLSYCLKPEQPPKIMCKVPLNEWASVVAFTSNRGENGETFREAHNLLALLPEPPA